jgi:type I restriction enzyme S subunit
LDGANLTENACKLVFNKDVLNKFVYYFTITKSFKEQALKNTRIAAQPKLALARLKTIELGIPPLEVQKRIVSEFDNLWKQTQHLEIIYQQKLTALTELKQSLLQKAFTGELTAKPETALKQEAVA